MNIPDYHVHFFVFNTPLELENRINEICQDEKLILVGCTSGYFIFKDSDSEFKFKLRESHDEASLAN